MGQGGQRHQARTELIVDKLARIAVDTPWGPVAVRANKTAGRCLFFLHGIGGNAGAWKKQYDAFDKDFRVIGWDAPGYGGSFDFAAENPTLEDYAAAFGAVLDALDLNQVALVGHSFGGLIAACAAAKYPERIERLVLTACSSGHASYDEEKRNAILRMRTDAFAGGDATAYARSRVKNLLSPAAPADIVEEAASVMAQIKQPGFPQATRMVSASDIFPYLSHIGMPTRVICGTADQVTPPELNRKIAESIAGADFVAVEGAGHWLFLEYPEQFNAALRQFVK